MTPGRKGPWMQTNSGGRWYPQDPYSGELKIGDLANGNALDCRYAGQGRVDRFYSVAEHQVKGAQWALDNWRTLNLGHYQMLVVAFLFLIHDTPEGFYRDLNRATKVAVGEPYKALERTIWLMLLDRYNLHLSWAKYGALVKEIDCRMVPVEKAAVMKHQLPWAFDDFEPLPGVVIECWSPVRAKTEWVNLYRALCRQLGWEAEEIEI